ncbi:AMP-binding protein [Arthrobacter sp. I2-34]|uniref:AMP-binding protein n=1 Tax=Arthrobacter hankyongi TaxID=2904801 RepID=A0ABS9L3H2_9MICC|nr:AMP-binding protein [Arthrobacter hankyongi]MCG2621225.1 AMP-binding protein [Arthrobacter hankyongi]
MTTFIEFIERHAQERPLDKALSAPDGGVSITWEQFNRRTDEIAGALVKEGVRKGDRIGILDHNTIDAVEASVGAVKAGAIAVPLNWRLAGPELGAILASFGPRMVFSSAGLRPLLDEANAGVGAQVIELGTGGYAAWRNAGAGVAIEKPSNDPALPVCIMYTSGSTGAPKGVVFPNSAFSTVLPGVVQDEGIAADSVLLQVLPLFHIGGFAWLASAFIAGSESVLLPAAAPDSILQAVETYGVTHLCVVSTLLGLLIQEYRRNPTDTTTLSMIQCGGSPIPDAHLREAARIFGASFVTLYGLSEAGGLVANQILTPAMIDAGLDEQRLLSAGTAVGGVEVAIRDLDTGEDLPANADGEIVTRTTGGMSGYWNEPAKTAEVLSADGWLRTGDVGSLDEDGFLFIKSRVKDMIISGGENIYPAEIENVLVAHPGISAAAVVGVPHPKWGESPVAFITLHHGAVVTDEEAIAWCRERLASYKRPQAVFVADDLPRLGGGKVDRPALRAQAGSTFAVSAAADAVR